MNNMAKIVASHKQKLKKFLPIGILRAIKKIYLNHLIEKYESKPIDREEFQRMEYGVNLIGDIRAEIGLGQSMRLIANELELSKYSFGIYNFQLGGNLRRKDITWDFRMLENYPYAVNLFHINPQEVALAYLYLDRDIWKNHYNIAFWLWELEEFPKEYIETIKFFDEIWTPSEFASSSIRKVTDKPVYTIPYYVLAETDKRFNREYFHLPEDKFLYLVMYDTNSTMERKNPVGTLTAYKRAFLGSTANVGLVIKVNNATAQDLQVIREQLSDCKNIYLITQTLDKIQVNSLIADVDVFVSLHRAEGFGLVMAEAMLVGTVCVATDWSSNTEFMSADSACMVPYCKKPIGESTGNYKKGYVWAEPDVGVAAAYMRYLYENPVYYRQLADDAKKQIQKVLGKERIIGMLEERLQKIANKSGLETL